MDWYLVNGLSAVPAFISLIVLIVGSFKVRRSVRATAILTRRLHKMQTNLDDSASTLHKQRLVLRGEIKKLDEKIFEIEKIRHETEKTIDYMVRLRAQLQQEAIRASTPSKPVKNSSNASPAQPAADKNKKLPVFVRRKIEKSQINPLIPH